MSDGAAAARPNDAPAPTAIEAPKSGLRAALEHTGIPTSWLSKRPKLPSRNWLIFLSVTSSLVGAYVYDRRQCRKIREEYCGRVRYLAEQPLHPMALSKKVTVYGARWPGDEDYDRALKYFRKYVKPIFVAAAIDYEMIPGKRHGDIARHVADQLKSRRRIDAGLDPLPQTPMPNLPAFQPDARERLGTVIVGRATLKEYMEGLARGWGESLKRVDDEEMLARELAEDGHFDEVDTDAGAGSDGLEGEPIPTKSRLPPSILAAKLSPLALAQTPTPPPSPEMPPDYVIEPAEPEAPASIPTQPPLLLVPFTNYIGFKQIPLMLFDFFNERKHVRIGAEAAYRLVRGHTREFDAPSLSAEPSGDLAFDLEGESYYKGSLVKTPEELEKARAAYYKALPAKLKTARDLARGVRAPTKDEEAHPPPGEVELRAERLRKELRWRRDAEGWEIVRPAQAVRWDERMRGALRVFDEEGEDKGVES